MNSSFENLCPGQANGLPAYYFVQTVQMLIATHCTLGNPDDYPKDSTARLDDSFDFIIVGGGSSGSVLANRLSEVKDWKVLLIESGGDPTFESDIPGFGLSLPGRDLDWKLTTSADGSRSCLGMEDETCPVFQGRVLGGTSTINRMHYLRGNPADFDEWEKLGNEGWSFRELLRYFKKSENIDENFNIVNDSDYEELFENSKKTSEDDYKLYQSSKLASGWYHSKGGKLSVNYFSYDFYNHRLKKAIFDGAEELGLPHTGDVNRNAQIGYTRVLGTIHEGNRGNAAKAFLTPVKDRPNLFVLKRATVQRILFEGKTATGVRLLKENKMRTFTAKKDVIVSAGAVNSPRLLLVSGIGDERHLREVGVSVVEDLPGVGENLQAHVTYFGLPVVLRRKSDSLTHLQKIDAMYQFISRGTGFFGSIGVTDVVGFVSTTNDTIPDVEMLHYVNHARDYYTFNELLISVKVKDSIRHQLSKVYADNSILLICPTLIKPKSRGKVELRGSSFKTPPRIIGNFLQDKDDVRALIKGIQLGIDLTKTKAFREFQPEVLNLQIEECGNPKSEEYWECQVRHLATSTHDVSGTCKMGPKSDPFAVVDSRLRVHGIDRLRVVDSSVMPSIVRGSTAVAAVMIAEKAADIIKKDWSTHEEL